MSGQGLSARSDKVAEEHPDQTRTTPYSGPPGDAASPRIPNHEMLRRIGSGSFGEVWLARNIMGTYRAVKVVYRKTFSDERPYQREFRGLQKFEPVSRSHDGFVDILEAGRDDANGYFYYVMEVADDAHTGQRIDPQTYEPKTLGVAKGERGWLPIEGCISLGASLSAALVHLHQSGLLHRDIKPSNIIFVNGIPKIADIGLVTTVEGTQTFAGGTPGYFPDEGPGTVQADIYAIGKVLYEASTGQDLREFPTLPAEWDKMHEPDLALELNLIFCRACENEPRLRYRKAQDLHADLLLLLAGKSVQRIRALERLVARMIRIGVVVAAIVAIGGSVLYHLYQKTRIEAERDQQKVGRTVAQGNGLVEAGDYFGALPPFVEALRLQEQDPVRAAAHRLRIGTVLQQCPKIVQMGFVDNTINAADFGGDGSFAVTAGTDGTAMICDLTSHGTNVLWLKHPAELECIALSRDGKLLALGGESFVQIWEMKTHTLICSVTPPDTTYSVKFNSDGSQFVTGSGNDVSGYIGIWNTASGRLDWNISSSTGAYRCAAFSPDDQRLITVCEGGIARIWDIATHRPVGEPIHHDGWGRWGAFSPDGRRVVTGAEDVNVLICDAATATPLLRLKHPTTVRMAEFSPDGRYVVTACWDYTVRIWDAVKGELLYPVLKESGKHVVHASFSADGRRVLTANANGVLCTWDLAPVGWVPSQRLLIPSASGHHWVAIETNGASLFSQKNRTTGIRLPVSFAVADARLNDDGARVALLSQRLPSATNLVQAQCWDRAAGPLHSRALALGEKVQDAFLSYDGRWLAALTDTNVVIWNTTNGAVAFSLGHPGHVNTGCLSTNGDWLATTCGHDLYLWDMKGRQLRYTRSHVDNLSHVAFSPNNRWLVACCDSHGTLFERSAYVYEVQTGKTNCSLPHRDGVLYAEFSADSRRLLTASEDNTAQIWDPSTGKPLLLPLQHSSQVKDAQFSEDGRWIVTACDWGRSAQLWDADTGEALTPRLKHPWGLIRAQFVAGQFGIVTRESQKDEPHRDEPYRSALWELRPDTRELTNLIALAQLLSGSPSGKDNPTNTAADFRHAWNTVCVQCPEDFKVTLDQAVQWHLREAQASERSDLWKAALFHWHWLAATKPQELAFRQRENWALEVLSYSEP